jgi:hypothetical protein
MYEYDGYLNKKDKFDRDFEKYQSEQDKIIPNFKKFKEPEKKIKGRPKQNLTIEEMKLKKDKIREQTKLRQIEYRKKIGADVLNQKQRENRRLEKELIEEYEKKQEQIKYIDNDIFNIEKMIVKKQEFAQMIKQEIIKLYKEKDQLELKKNEIIESCDHF